MRRSIQAIVIVAWLGLVEPGPRWVFGQMAEPGLGPKQPAQPAGTAWPAPGGMSSGPGNAAERMTPAGPADLQGQQASGPGAAPAPTSPNTTASPPPAIELRRVQEALPPLYYLKDKEGNLVPVPGYRLEDFEAMVRRQHRLEAAETAPRYTLQSIEAVGTAQTDYAELVVHGTFVTHEAGWVRLPLRFDQAVLRKPQEYRGAGRQFMQYEPGGEGYVLWVRAEPDQEHQISLNLVVPVDRVGEASRLRLIVPRATRSEIKLTVPTAGALAEVSQGATLLPTSPVGSTSTLVTAVGLGGDFELTWRPPGTASLRAEAVLEAIGGIRVKADGRTFDTEANLTVRGLSGPFDRFRVRLPKDAELLPGTTSQYTIVPLNPPESQGQPRPTLEIRLPKKTLGPVEIQLRTRIPHAAARAGDYADVASYEVLGAVRQHGYVGVQTASGWRVLVGPLRNAHQVDRLPETFSSGEVAVSFEYTDQPCAVPIRAVRRTPHVTVEPEYLLSVDADRVTLEARLKYVVRTAELKSFDLECLGWQIDELGPEHLVDRKGADEQSGVLSFPVAKPVIGPVEFTLRAHQPIPPGTKRLSIALPRPRADAQASAAVVVVPADDVELVPDPGTMVGLVRQQAIPAAKLPARQQEPLFYRAESSNAVFSAGFRVHAQKVSVRVTTEITLEAGRADVEQKFAYQVAYKLLDRLTLEVPATLTDADRVVLRCEGQPVRLADLPDAKHDRTDARPVRKGVLLPQAKIGPCELVTRYSLDLPPPWPEVGQATTIPLVMPAEGQLVENVVRVWAREGVGVRAQQSPWKQAERSGSAPARAGYSMAVQATSPQPAHQIVLVCTGQAAGFGGFPIVERAWVQTWLTGQSRQDRAAFRFTTSRKTVELILPPGASAGQTELWVNGERAVAQALSNERLVVPLPDAHSPRPHQLEVICRFSSPRPPPGRMAIQLPLLAPEAWIQRLYWQLVLPANEHVVTPPPDCSGEYRWGWNGVFWGRLPTLDQSELERWSGARRLAPVPNQTNRYVFSAAGTAGRFELRTVDRAWAVLAASAVALAGGFLLIYLPAARHPASLLGLAVALAAGGAICPGLALLAAQAAAFGVLLALGAAWLERLVAPPSPGPRDLESTRTSPVPDGEKAVRASPAVSEQASQEALSEPAPVSITDSPP